MKNIVIAVVAIALVTGGLFFFTQKSSYEKKDTDEIVVTKEEFKNDDVMPVEPDNGIGDGAQALDELIDETKTVIGQSANGNDITAYHFGTGDKEILFIGGIHAGYSLNTVLVAYELIDMLDNPDAVPAGLRVTVIPTLNPDGQKVAIGTTGQFTSATTPASASKTIEGRFNGNNVDLNRNFDCKWKSDGVWQSRTVSGGSAAFSESEAAALRDYVTAGKPTAVVAYYAAAGGVYASSCTGGVSPETASLTSAYADASGYASYEEFDSYEITGDMVNWFAKLKVPAISILLNDHTDIEWDKNKKGIQAVLDKYAQ